MKLINLKDAIEPVFTIKLLTDEEIDYMKMQNIDVDNSEIGHEIAV